MAGKGRNYQPIGRRKDGAWTNFDEDYFERFGTAKMWVERNARNLTELYGLEMIGLDVFDRDKDEFLKMFWEYKDGVWSRNYKD